MNESTLEWLDAVEGALSVGTPIVSSVEQFDLVCDHIVTLLQDASHLLGVGSHATSVFLSVAAIEETSKLHIGMFRKAAKQLRRSKDPLYGHSEKHRLAASPTITVGNRLRSAIGDERVHALTETARSGGLSDMRESALYVDHQGEKLLVPHEVIHVSTARDLLLFAIEIFDDGLVGYTVHSLDLGSQTDVIFSRWASGDPGGLASST